eukprot:scaffold71659_cov57-Attheya_sp.AAC.6
MSVHHVTTLAVALVVMECVAVGYECHLIIVASKPTEESFPSPTQEYIAASNLQSAYPRDGQDGRWVMDNLNNRQIKIKMLICFVLIHNLMRRAAKPQVMVLDGVMGGSFAVGSISAGCKKPLFVIGNISWWEP